MLFRWTTKKGLLALSLFLIVTALIEYLIVVYATNLGVKDASYLQSSLRLPGTDWNLVIGISPLFHLVPISVMMVLVASWMCLTRYLPIRPVQAGKAGVERSGKRQQAQNKRSAGKSVLSKINVFAYVGGRFRSARPTIRSAITLFIVFMLLVVAVSLLTYPKLIYHAVSNAYQSNQALLDFVKGTGQTLASVGSVFSGVNSALLGSSPGTRDFFAGLGGAIGPLASLDGAGKYLVFQNAAAWLSALIVLLYGEYRRSRQYKKR